MENVCDIGKLKKWISKQYYNWTLICVYVCASYICLATQIHTCRRRERSGGRGRGREREEERERG